MSHRNLYAAVLGFMTLVTAFWLGLHAAARKGLAPQPLNFVGTDESIAPGFVSVQEGRMDARIHQLRVAEIRGKLFEGLALDFLRGDGDPTMTMKACRLAAEKFEADEYSLAAVREGSEQFCRAVEAAMKEGKP